MNIKCKLRYHYLCDWNLIHFEHNWLNSVVVNVNIFLSKYLLVYVSTGTHDHGSRSDPSSRCNKYQDNIHHWWHNWSHWCCAMDWCWSGKTFFYAPRSLYLCIIHSIVDVSYCFSFCLSVCWTHCNKSIFYFIYNFYSIQKAYIISMIM